MENGIIMIDKPAGMTSFGVVARIRRVLNEGRIKGQKRIKVGHTGTLDPFATGLMILVVGAECKQAARYTKQDKVYEATIELGRVSSTGDPEGGIEQKSSRQPTRSELDVAVAHFQGVITQRPPIFSAIKINGQRAYKLARDGQEVEIPLRQIEVYSLEIIEYSYPTLKIRVHVSSGTYIRSLAVDIGEALGTGAYCSQLRRLTVGSRSVVDASTLADFGITS